MNPDPLTAALPKPDDRLITCHYCGLKHDKVEAGGIYYCPNPYCHGPGGHWFRLKLKSYKDDGPNHHVVEDSEWRQEAQAWVLTSTDIELRKFVAERLNITDGPLVEPCTCQPDEGIEYMCKTCSDAVLLPKFVTPPTPVTVQELRELTYKHGKAVSVLVCWDEEDNNWQLVTAGKDKQTADIAVTLRDQIAELLQLKPIKPLEDRRSDHCK